MLPQNRYFATSKSTICSDFVGCGVARLPGKPRSGADLLQEADVSLPLSIFLYLNTTSSRLFTISLQQAFVGRNDAIHHLKLLFVAGKSNSFRRIGRCRETRANSNETQPRYCPAPIIPGGETPSHLLVYPESHYWALSPIKNPTTSLSDNPRLHQHASHASQPSRWQSLRSSMGSQRHYGSSLPIIIRFSANNYVDTIIRRSISDRRGQIPTNRAVRHTRRWGPAVL
jgi:hypothetical protein